MEAAAWDYPFRDSPGLSGDPKVQVEGVFGSRFRFAFQFRAVSVPVSLFHYKRKTRNCDVQFLLVHFVHGPFTKTGNPSFSGSCWWSFRVHFPEILNAMLVARRASGFQFPFHQSTCIFTCFYCTVNMFIHVSRFRDQVRLAQCFPNFNKWSWISHKKYRQTKKHQANDLSSWSWFTNTHDELIPHMVKNCHKDPKTISLFAQYWI